MTREGASYSAHESPQSHQMQETAEAPTVPLALAPMAGFSDACFRLICRELGADVTVTEMISAKGLVYENARTEALLACLPGEEHVTVQLFGREPDTVAEAARRVQTALGGRLAGIDLNMGCPARKITGNGEGSALMREPALAGRVIESTVRAVKAPVTVKLRKGWDAAHANAPEMARIAEESGAAGVTVHPRTREEQYAGKADWDVIGEVVRGVSIPVMGNGDIESGADALAMLRATGCAGLMIGRGALGNPWIFAEARAALSGGAFTPPTLAEKRALLLRHARMAEAAYGAHAIIAFRKHAACYMTGEPNASRLRAAVQACNCAGDLAKILDSTERRTYNMGTM